MIHKYCFHMYGQIYRIVSPCNTKRKMSEEVDNFILTGLLKRQTNGMKTKETNGVRKNEHNNCARCFGKSNHLLAYVNESKKRNI
jgi:hypothetical protein